MEKFDTEMRSRTAAFASKIYSVLSSKKTDFLNRSMVEQLLRSSSSIAANFRAAMRARSYAEFYSKICIVTEECDETQYWINLLINIKFLCEPEAAELKKECEELIKIFSRTKQTIRKNLKIKK